MGWDRRLCVEKKLDLVPSDTFSGAKCARSYRPQLERPELHLNVISPRRTIGMVLALLSIGILVAGKGKQNGQTENAAPTDFDLLNQLKPLSL